MSDALAIGTSWWRLIEDRAAATPDQPFILDERNRVITFDRFRDLAEEVAAGLLILGVEFPAATSLGIDDPAEPYATQSVGRIARCRTQDHRARRRGRGARRRRG